jgi:hypothetical protein
MDEIKLLRDYEYTLSWDPIAKTLRLEQPGPSASCPNSVCFSLSQAQVLAGALRGAWEKFGPPAEPKGLAGLN